MTEERTIGRLTEHGLQLILLRNAVTAIGQAEIRKIREGEPVTAPVADRKIGNTTGVYPSSTMHAALQIGSVVPDLFMCMELDNRERHPTLYEYWNRPTQIPNVVVRNLSGKHLTTKAHKPRMLCIEEEGVYFLDYHREADLERLVAEGSALYRRNPNGTWTSPAVSEALIPLGIGHRIWVDTQFGEHYVGNVSYLASVFRGSWPSPSNSVVKQIIERVETQHVVYRRELVEEGFDADDIKWVIAHQLVYFPLEEEDLLNVEMARLYVDRSAYLDYKEQRRMDGAGPPLPVTLVLPKAGQTVEWHGVPWLIVNAGDVYTLSHRDGRCHEVTLKDVEHFCSSRAWTFNATPDPTFNTVSDKRRAEAAEKVRWLNKPTSEWVWTYGPKLGKPMSLSTIARIKARATRAENSGVPLQLALVNGYDNCGDRSNRTGGEMDVWRECLSEYYLQNHRPRFSSAWALYLLRCDELKIKGVSETTARRRLKKERKSVIVEAREGEFVAYQRGNYRPRDKSNRLVKGRVPWEVGQVDHAKIEVEVRSTITGELMTKPCWRTVLRDACTFRVIGLVVFFGSPSYQVLYRLLIDVVRRFGRLPQYVISDRGLEFLAAQWDITLANCGATKLNRPARTPRAGQVSESGNKKDDENIISNLVGNKLRLPDFRKMAQGFRPKETAVLSLGTIREVLEDVYFNVEPKHPTSRTHGESLEKYEARLLREMGTSHIPAVKYSNEFRIMCMPTVEGRGGIRTVTAQGSVEANTLEYFSSELKAPGVVGESIKVHYDPDNCARVFVWLIEKRMWAECRCNEYAVLSQFTSTELEEYTAYLKQSGENSKVEGRRNRAKAYATALRAAEKSKVLIRMHEEARENAHGFEGFTVVDGRVCIDLNQDLVAEHEEVPDDDASFEPVETF
jgi:putative transposase